MKYNKDLYGALWLSDIQFDESMLNFGSLDELTIYDNQDLNLQYSDPIIEDLEQFSNNEPIHLASLYVWKSELIYYIYSICKGIYELSLENVEEDDKFNVTLENIASSIGELTDLIFTIFSSNGSLKKRIVLKVVNIGIHFALDKMVAFLKRTIENDLLYYLTYITYLLGVINGRFGDLSLQDNLMNLMSRDKKETLEIPIYYEIKSTNVLGHKTRTLDFRSTYHQLDSNFYNNNYIYVEKDCDYYSSGNVYALDFNENFSVGDKICNYPDVTPNVENVNIYQNIEKNNIEYKEINWYSFTAPVTGKYYFINKNQPLLVVDTFSIPDLGYENTHFLHSYYGGYNTINGNNLGCYFYLNLLAGQSIYLRVRGYNYLQLNHYSFEISDIRCEEVLHSHVYNYSYEWYNNLKHKSYCECGNYQFQPHAVVSGTHTCIICGGYASQGFVPINSLSTITYSYISSNGVIVLKENDVYDYISGNFEKIILKEAHNL